MSQDFSELVLIAETSVFIASSFFLML